MDLTQEQLLTLIGQKELDLYALRIQNQKLQGLVQSLQHEVENLTDENIKNNINNDINNDNFNQELKNKTGE